MRLSARSFVLTVTLGSSFACAATRAHPIPLAAPSPPPFTVSRPLGMDVLADSDRDGVPDPYDACPGLPGVLSAVIVLNGCPPAGYYDDALGPHDGDGDGVADDSDACRNDPGPTRAVPQISGCPEAWVEGDRVRILEPVRFASGSTDLLAESTPVLEGVATVLGRRADITKLLVEGHTDGRGGPVTNRRLSLGRATRVTRFLVDHGVLEARLEAHGIGPDRPIDTNETEAGRATNRRVEFHVVGTAAEPDAKDGLLPPEPPRETASPSPPSASFDSSGL